MAFSVYLLVSGKPLKEGSGEAPITTRRRCLRGGFVKPLAQPFARREVVVREYFDLERVRPEAIAFFFPSLNEALPPPAPFSNVQWSVHSRAPFPRPPEATWTPSPTSVTRHECHSRLTSPFQRMPSQHVTSSRGRIMSSSPKLGTGGGH